VCDLETSRIGAPYIYDISHLRVKKSNIHHYGANCVQNTSNQHELWSSQKIKIVLIVLVLSFFIINNNVSNIIRRLMENMNLLFI